MPAAAKHYALRPNPAVLMVRPRGWHLPETHVTVDGEPCRLRCSISASTFGTARLALDAGSGPYFYLPKLEEPARGRAVERRVRILGGMARPAARDDQGDVLIETLPAAFEMDEIIHALRENIVGLNCGRWDYIFSFIKRLGRSPDRLTPDRSAMTMDKAFLAAYSLRLIATCHRRGAFAMGGMSAFIPVKENLAANVQALDKVRVDKLREVTNGHDGTWVAHPALVPVALDVFASMDGPNQLEKMPERIPGREEMLELHQGIRTEAGARENIRVAVQYIAAWLGGRGAVPLYNLMEDAATAEICRAQLWQWLRFEAPFEDGRRFSRDLFEDWLAEELAALDSSPHLRLAARPDCTSWSRRRGSRSS
jgi:malate synthase